jgi:hypothetical protein
MLKIELETGEQFEVKYKRMTSDTVALIVDDEQDNRIAFFKWNDLTGEIATIRVEPDVNGINYRRRGIATELLRIANTHMRINHSGYRSPEGNIWAESTGDYLPPLIRT